MAKYTIYLEQSMSYGILHTIQLCMRDNLDTLFIDGNYYFLYKDVLEHQLEYHILRLTDLGYKVLFIKPVEE